MKYKIGDRVQTISEFDGIKAGEIGTVIKTGDKLCMIDFIRKTTYMMVYNITNAPIGGTDRHYIMTDNDVINFVNPKSGQTLDEYLVSLFDNIGDLKEHYITGDIVRHELVIDSVDEIRLKCYRLETDQEYDERIEYERSVDEIAERTRIEQLEKKKAKQAVKDAKEFAEYERLKAKFG